MVIVLSEIKYNPHALRLVKAVEKLVEKEYKDTFEIDFLHSICDSLNICSISTTKEGEKNNRFKIR